MYAAMLLDNKQYIIKYVWSKAEWMVFRPVYYLKLNQTIIVTVIDSKDDAWEMTSTSKEGDRA